MKRAFRFGGEVEMESISMANVLMLLAHGGGGGGEDIDHLHHGHQNHMRDECSPARVFECKTCSRQFPSFQALGGHRASHKKPRMVENGHGQATSGVIAKQRVHECSICGLEFAIGQALGGHMRRHRANPEGFAHHAGVEKKSGGGGGGGGGRTELYWLDLNLPPRDEDAERRMLGLGLQLVSHKNSSPMVDCFR